MARPLRTDIEIDKYISRIILQTNHHAKNVDAVIMPLSQSVRSRINLNIDSVQVFERDGILGRACWVTLNGKRYVFSYNYQNQEIDLRQRSTQGVVVDTFNNGTSMQQIQRTVNSM